MSLARRLHRLKTDFDAYELYAQAAAAAREKNIHLQELLAEVQRVCALSHAERRGAMPWAYAAYTPAEARELDKMLDRWAAVFRRHPVKAWWRR